MMAFKKSKPLFFVIAKYGVAIVFMLVVFVACKNNSKNKEVAQETVIIPFDEEAYRPNFHFTPKKGWMNDPNGMFYYNGYYHLYFQHYPDSTVWGPMHWGHAVSTDMISWRELPIALYPGELGDIWSGSAVLDKNNSSGFASQEGQMPIVAMYTNAKKTEIEDDPWLQTQGIAYSFDEGKTFTKYEGNPTLNNPGIPDFRDPKVNWDEANQRWIMVLAAGQEIKFYSSKDLKDWQFLSNFGEGLGNHGGVWECPDFVQLPVKGSDEKKWVLFVSINPGAPNGGSGTQYFVGDFDGTEFTLDSNYNGELSSNHTFWIDHGRDNYAGVMWSNIETAEGAKYFIGWMSNWFYANEVPTHPWRSATTIAREMSLTKEGKTYRLVSKPVKELASYHGKKYKKESIKVNEKVKLIDAEKIDLTKTVINFSISDFKEAFTFILSNDVGDELSFGFKPDDNTFFIDRTKSGKTDFSEKFADRVTTASRTAMTDEFNASIVLDKTSIELFYDDGQTVMTEIFFPNRPYETLSVSSLENEFIINAIEIHELKIN